jgi:hypothetical protein
VYLRKQANVENLSNYREGRKHQKMLNAGETINDSSVFSEGDHVSPGKSG